MILVAGGTGTLGREVVKRLTAGHDVRVLTRDAGHIAPIGVEVAIGDVQDPATLLNAVEGASVVISAVHGFLGGRGAGPEEIDREGNRNLIFAALVAGVEHFLLLSVLDAAPDHPMSLHRAKYAAEQDLKASGLSWTVLRPPSYVETWVEIIGDKLTSGGSALVFGHGDNPINFVSVQDVATVVERSLSDPALRSQTIDVPGPENLTMEQLARHLGASKIRRIPRGALRLLSMILPPVAPAFARQTRAALVMDTTDMTADPSALHARFPDVTWLSATAVAEQVRTAPGDPRSHGPRASRERFKDHLSGRQQKWRNAMRRFILFVTCAVALTFTATSPSASWAGAAGFQGTWTSTDFDGSNQQLDIRGSAPHILAVSYYDDAASVACGGAPAHIQGTGSVDGNSLNMTGTLTCQPGGNHLRGRISIAFTYSPATDTLTDEFGLTWVRS